MSRADTSQVRTCPLSHCAAEIRQLVDEECHHDLARLAPGMLMMAYVESDNATETWEVVEVGSTFGSVRMRLIDLVPENSAA